VVNFLYFVDPAILEAKIKVYEKQIIFLKQEITWENELQQRAFERSVTLLIEATLDVGNSIIDGFIMRDPGSFEDIIDILLDEKVINDEMYPALIELIRYRKKLMQEYENFDVDPLIQFIHGNHQRLSSFPQNVRQYVNDKLPTYHTFRPERLGDDT